MSDITGVGSGINVLDEDPRGLASHVVGAANMLFARTLDGGTAAVTGAGLRLEHNAMDDEVFRGTTVDPAIEPMASHVPSLGTSIEAGIAPVLQPGGTASAWIRATLGKAS